MEQAAAEFEKLSHFDGLPERHIAILGGGISGLVAAQLFGMNGQKVTLFEASNRIGGRILTHRYGDQHAELGAMRIPEQHHRTLFYCKLLGLPLEKFRNSDHNTFYRIRGHTVPVTKPERLTEIFHLTDSDRNRVKFGPYYVLEKFVREMSQDLTPEDRKHVISGDISEAHDRVKLLDNITIRDFLLTRAEKLDSNREAVEMIGDAIYLKDVWYSSCIALLREILNNRSDPQQICTGMDRLPEGMARALETKFSGSVEIRCGTPVTGIDIGLLRPAGINLTIGDEHQGYTRERFDYALCTLPFSVLRHMRLNGFSNGKCDAIDQYQYAASTKVILNFTERFWETTDQPIFGGVSVTDDIACQMFYPSNPDEPGGDVSQPLPLQYPSIDLSNVSTPQQPVADPGPGVMIGSYSWGTNARRLGALPPAERIQVVKQCVRAIHGEDVDKYFDGGASMAWEQHRWSAGAFSQPLVRGLQLHRDDAMCPEHKLYFSGEHLSPDPGWIEGSISSTWVNVGRILNDMRND